MPNAVRMHDERAAFLSLEQMVWREGPVCPHCGETSRLGRLSGLSTSVGAWKCYACRKPFTVRHGTIFQNSHVPIHVWLQMLYLLAASGHRLGSQKLGQILGISVRTAWHLKTKIAAGLAAAKESPASHDVEPRMSRVAREPIENEASPPQPGQVVYKARYERFLKALEDLADHDSDARFLEALHLLLSGAPGPERNSPALVELQLELSLFDGPAPHVGEREHGDTRPARAARREVGPGHCERGAA